jgi:hypothetical protein
MRKLIVAAFILTAACGSDAPCQDAGVYCEGNTLCVNGAATECVAATGGECATPAPFYGGQVRDTVPACQPPRPPPVQP